MPDEYLPDDWSPVVLDDLEREEFDHLAGYGMAPTDIMRRLKWQPGTLANRWRRYKEEKGIQK
ncbi:hypothetical protein SEA_BETTERKATZ_56 [Gordonia phage BetterKatz]|uniref:Helix-turn-helix DNA binding domain protein n=1 Tax=Gordonia phage BetterKatz TaxID=1821551 RepID=A0A142KC58_9CAUD|nr:hypothetical protein BJD67_gp56 [Gordonia phage BetterKatz]AMS03691.1 hypothetical protein SEA_BETTERKATZ_56 [Gordonia phage BetterKatz]